MMTREEIDRLVESSCGADYSCIKPPSNPYAHVYHVTHNPPISRDDGKVLVTSIAINAQEVAEASDPAALIGSYVTAAKRALSEIKINQDS